MLSVGKVYVFDDGSDPPLNTVLKVVIGLRSVSAWPHCAAPDDIDTAAAGVY